MSGTEPQPNNVSVKFKGKAEREMAKSVGKLPKHVRKARKSGMISDAQLKKHYDGA